MALFKILKGDSSNLGAIGNITEYAHEGYAYFTPDNGKFYIDILGDGATTKAVIGENRVALNAAKAECDINGDQIDLTYIKKIADEKQYIQVRYSGTALRLISNNKHGSLLEFANMQTTTDENGESTSKVNPLGYLGIWDNMPCYYAADGTVNGLLTIILDETDSGTAPKTNSDQLGGIDAANYVTKIKLKEVVSEQMNEVLLEGAW